MKNSNRKGKRLERALCNVLREMGYEARRSEQYHGKGREAADIQHDIPGVRIECKGGYNDAEFFHKTVEEWIAQADAECDETNEEWVIFWKKDYKPWTALVRMSGVLVHTTALQEAIERARYRYELKQAKAA